MHNSYLFRVTDKTNPVIDFCDSFQHFKRTDPRTGKLVGLLSRGIVVANEVVLLKLRSIPRISVVALLLTNRGAAQVIAREIVRSLNALAYVFHVFWTACGSDNPR